MEPRSFVTFKSTAFNTRESRDHFINPENYGDDVARWLMDDLKAQGIEVEGELGQEDFGWYFAFNAGGRSHHFILGHRDDTDEWLGWLEPVVGFFASLLGGRNKGVEPRAVDAIHRVLAGSDRIHEVRWHYRKDMDRGREELGSATPIAV
jgi:hypothetical protein